MLATDTFEGKCVSVAELAMIAVNIHLFFLASIISNQALKRLLENPGKSGSSRHHEREK
jgi:hypothetical protein